GRTGLSNNNDGMTREDGMRRMMKKAMGLAAGVAMLASGTALPVGAAVVPSATVAPAQAHGDLAAGPYRRLVILNAMVIPGHGGPAAGPYDIVIEGNRIAEMIALDPVTLGRRGASSRPTGDRVIDATGKFVMPGM